MGGCRRRTGGFAAAAALAALLARGRLQPIDFSLPTSPADAASVADDALAGEDVGSFFPDLLSGPSSYFSDIIGAAAAAGGAPDDAFAGVKFRSGYIPVSDDGSEIFYWFFPRQGDGAATADPAPLVVWMTGGPGCSSEMAALTENGPLQIEGDMTVLRNPHGWTKLADVVYVDQPVGTGFSIAAASDDFVKSETEVARDMHAFLTGFIKEFAELAGHPFYITGESYAGHYIPAVAESLVDRPIDGLDFKGVAIGNGWVDPVRQYPAYADFARANQLVGPIGYALAKKGYDVCASLLQRSHWELALVQCNSVTNGLLGKLNPYDIRLNCDSPPLCYNETALDLYMNVPAVQKALGVRREWQECSSTVYAHLLGDWCLNLTGTVGKLLKNNLRVLIYNGDQDFICNWMGGLRWVKAVPWDKQKEFSSADFVQWKVDGKPMGALKQVDNFAFLRVYGAGHMVPMDQPVAALEMLNQFLYEPKMLENSRRKKSHRGKPAVVARDEAMPLAAFAVSLLGAGERAATAAQRAGAAFDDWGRKIDDLAHPQKNQLLLYE